MREVIWKIVLNLDNEQLIRVPRGTKFLSVQSQHDGACVWYQCNPEAEMTTRYLSIIPTGKDFDPAGCAYLGTFLIGAGFLVFHVYVDEILDV